MKSKQAQPVVLTREELQEFRLRHDALRVAEHQALLVREAYQAWVAKTLHGHGIERGQIDLQTGDVVVLESVARKGGRRG